ncbi:MAG: hypothetical protein WB792_14075 [Desulfobacterales bacterium]|jgi:hypothetical protein
MAVDMETTFFGFGTHDASGASSRDRCAKKGGKRIPPLELNASYGKSSTSGDEVLNNVLLPMKTNLHVMFFGFYDFPPQIAEIYAKRMTNDLFFFFHKFHIIHLQAVFNATALIIRIQSRHRVKRASVKTN